MFRTCHSTSNCALSRQALRACMLALSLALASFSPGCSYARQLGKDAAECLHFSVGASASPGLYARLQAPVFGTSVGWLPAATYVGTDYGFAYVWQQAGAGVVLGGQLVRTDLETDIETYWTGYLADAYLDQSHYFVLNLVATDIRTSLGAGQIGISKIEAGLHALFVGVQVGVDVLEVLDLLTGVFGWDLLRDEHFGQEDTTPPTSPSPPADSELAEPDPAPL